MRKVQRISSIETSSSLSTENVGRLGRSVAIAIVSSDEICCPAQRRTCAESLTLESAPDFEADGVAASTTEPAFRFFEGEDWEELGRAALHDGSDLMIEWHGHPAYAAAVAVGGATCHCAKRVAEERARTLAPAVDIRSRTEGRSRRP